MHENSSKTSTRREGGKFETSITDGWIGKLMELAELAKLTTSMKNKKLSTLLPSGNYFWTSCLGKIEMKL